MKIADHMPVSLGPQLDPRDDPGKQFEGFLLQQMVRALRKTVPEGMFGDLAGPFGDLMDQELATALADSGQFGLQERLLPDLGKTSDGALTAAPGDRFRPPLRGSTTSGFGGRKDPITGRHRAHRGMDIAAARGTPVRPTRAGVVEASGVSGSYGNYVVVDHGGGWKSRYAHLDERRVAEGQQLSGGEVLGTVGSTGRSTGPHLHFELERDGVAVDPAAWLVP